MSSIVRVAVTALLVLAAAPVAAQSIASRTEALSPGAEGRARASSLLEQPAHLKVEQALLPAALDELHRRSGVVLAFSPSLLPANLRVTCECEARTVGEALEQILGRTSFQYSELGSQVVIEPRQRQHPLRVLPPPPPAPVFASYIAQPSRPARASAMPTAAQTGTITGQVVEARTQRPLAGAQVLIAGTGLGTLTNNAGRFMLVNVPAGTATVRVQMLGFGTAEQTVTVVSGETITVNFELAQQAIALDEVVVTGTAGGTQRRAVGNVVERLSAAEVLEVAPATDVSQLIGQRTPGVVMLGAAGAVGTGTRVRIRGAGSMGLPNDPIVYIDGVRMDSNPASGPTQRGGARISRLNDINPEDIESVEIIKGPAAATLYGTEASNGVIQIVTKRGATGAPRFDITTRLGTHWLWNPAGRQGLSWARDPSTGELVSFNVYEHERDYGVGPIFTNGFLQSYAGNISGGTDQVRYFISGSWQDDTGVRPENWDRRSNVRANVDLLLLENLNVTTSLGYVQGQTRLAQGGFNNDPFSNIFWANPRFIEHNRGFFRAPPEEWVKIQNRQDIDRFTGSVQLRFQPWQWFTHRLVGGVDTNQEHNFTLTPRQPEGRNHFWGAAALGEKTSNRVMNRVVTVDYSASASHDFLAALSSQTSVGFQYYRSEIESVTASGQEFPAPGLTTVTAAASRDGNETFLANATVGLYVQQQFGWQNRAFFTAAVRADDNSAFGAEFDAAIYPKVSATWVLHEEPFWNIGWVNQLRLRGAWGAAGQQPGHFDAARLLAPQIGSGDQPTLLPEAFGNPQLRPERGEELEVGFDAEFLHGRVGVIYTRFERNTKDAIVSRALPRSRGWPGFQIVNLGRVRGWGNELAVDFRVLEGRHSAWELGTQISTYENRIKDLGEDRDFIGTGEVRHHVGYSIGDIYYRTVVHAEIDEDGRLLQALCDGGTGPYGVDQGGEPVPCSTAPFVRWGHSQPTWDVGVNSTLTLGPVRFYGRVDAVGGHYQQDSSSPAAQTSLNLTLTSNLRNDPIFEAYRVVGRSPLGTYRAGFARLRELSATYMLPQGLAGRVGASRGTVTLAGRNLMMLWTAEHGWRTRRDGLVEIPIGDGKVWDPETRGMEDLAAGYQTVMPPLTSANLTVRLSF